MRFPKTLLEFQAQFPDEASCWAYLRRVRWPRGFVCPRCRGRGSHSIRTRRLEQCRQCRYQASVTAGTVFHRTHVPLRVWFLGIYFLSRHKHGISAKQFQRDTGVGSYQTAWTLLHKLRSGMVPRTVNRLWGDVEADETYIGGYRPGQRGRGLGKTGIAVAVERRQKTAGAARLETIPDASGKTLSRFVEGVIDPRRATLFTDGWVGYAPLQRKGIKHRPRVAGRGRQAAEVLPWAHTVFGNLKNWLRGTFHGVSPKHLQRYLDEFVYRFNYRWSEDELFALLNRRAARSDPFPYRQLTAMA